MNFVVTIILSILPSPPKVGHWNNDQMKIIGIVEHTIWPHFYWHTNKLIPTSIMHKISLFLPCSPDFFFQSSLPSSPVPQPIASLTLTLKSSPAHKHHQKKKKKKRCTSRGSITKSRAEVPRLSTHSQRLNSSSWEGEKMTLGFLFL